MSELISGKEALIALANGEEVQWITGDEFRDIDGDWQIKEFSHPSFKFRLKPRTITLNGVEVEQIHSSEWNKNNPQKVILEFKNEDAARFFQSKALEIFNDMK